MKTVSDVLGVARSNLIEQKKDRPPKRMGRGRQQRHGGRPVPEPPHLVRGRSVTSTCPGPQTVHRLAAPGDPSTAKRADDLLRRRRAIPRRSQDRRAGSSPGGTRNVGALPPPRARAACGDGSGVVADGSYTVLVPSVPTLMAGALYILPRERAYPVDVPFTKALRVFSKWAPAPGNSSVPQQHDDVGGRRLVEQHRNQVTHRPYLLSEPCAVRLRARVLSRRPGSCRKGRRRRAAALFTR